MHDRLDHLKVAVAVDGGAASAAALDLLMTVARRPSLSITVLSVVPTGLGTLEHPDMLFRSTAAMRLEATLRMKDAVRRLDGAGLRAKGLILEGRPDVELVRAVRHHGYELMVVGSHSSSLLNKALMGSVSSYVLHHSPSAVLVVHPVAQREAPVRVMLATDGSDEATAGIGFASRLLDRDACILKAVSVTASDPVQPILAPGAYVPLINEHERHRLRLNAEHAVDRATDILWGEGFSVSSVVADGPAELTIERIARDWSADLVIVGSRGLNVAERVMLGSVSSALVRRAPAALVVRPQTQRVTAPEVRRREPAFV